MKASKMFMDFKTLPEYMFLRKQELSILLALGRLQHLVQYSAHSRHPINTMWKADSLDFNQYYSCAK